MSALPSKADMCIATSDVRFGPIADILPHQLLTSSTGAVLRSQPEIQFRFLRELCELRPDSSMHMRVAADPFGSRNSWIWDTATTCEFPHWPIEESACCPQLRSGYGRFRIWAMVMHKSGYGFTVQIFSRKSVFLDFFFHSGQVVRLAYPRRANGRASRATSGPARACSAARDCRPRLSDTPLILHERMKPRGNTLTAGVKRSRRLVPWSKRTSLSDTYKFADWYVEFRLGIQRCFIKAS